MTDDDRGVEHGPKVAFFLRAVAFLSGVCRAIATFRQVVASLILQLFTAAVETSAKF
ncbi:hypothetical protein Osc7112_1140 [Oscillatoria nigro-viridis PCC 7112]|uniref:Uncharacterized protein n=1 Tax=Phormidium nigroviride PCC 7112 TaxID=179408 RepID=K9VDX0_9CYAN|nr:hypothetical protein [Oscillatoria nigro-viridis]AFZ05689.1 hypothetical protein Osc7112_1140 [Oscillatoria nigro-viridis PCC 7112]